MRMDGDQHTGRAGGQVRREPQQTAQGEARTPLVPDGVAAECPHLGVLVGPWGAESGHDVQQTRVSVEQPWREHQFNAQTLPDGCQQPRVAGVVLVPQVLVQHQADSGAAPIGRGDLLLPVPDVDRPCPGHPASGDVPGQRRPRVAEVDAVARRGEQAGEHQRRSRPAPHQPRLCGGGGRGRVRRVLHHADDLVGEPRGTVEAVEMQVGQGDTGQAAEEARSAPVKVERVQPGERLPRRLPAPEFVQYHRHTAEAVVQAGAGQPDGLVRPDQPVDVGGEVVVVMAPGGVQRVQDARGAVGQSGPLVLELPDVTGEEPVRTLGRRRAHDRVAQGVQDGRPVGGRAGAGARAGEEAGPARPSGRVRAVLLAGWRREFLPQPFSELRWYRERFLHPVGQFRHLARVESQQRGHGTEHGQPQACQPVCVDGDPLPGPGRNEADRAEGGGEVVPDGEGGLEVDQADAVVGPDHDVAGLQIPEHDAPPVQFGDRVLDPVQDVQGPAGVGGQLRFPGGIGTVQKRMTSADHRQQLLPVHQFLHQEVVLPVAHLAEQDGHDLQTGQPSHDVGLVRQPGHRVHAVGVHPGVRPCLAQDDRVAGVLLHGPVHPAAVGEVQGLLHPVRESALRRPACALPGVLDETGHLHPRRHPESGAAHVGDQCAVRVHDGRYVLAVGGEAVPHAEAPVAQVQRPLAPPQIAQDVRTFDIRQQRPEVLQDLLDTVGGRIEGDELAAGGAGELLSVDQLQHLSAAQELEADTALHAVRPHGVDDPGRVGRGRRDVDLPSLPRQLDCVAVEVDPSAALHRAPARRNRLVSRSEPGGGVLDPFDRVGEEGIRGEMALSEHGVPR